jgi:DNA polymerase-4
LAVSKFHGVGPFTADKMQRLGIHTGADLRKRSLEFLVEHFGKNGSWYYAIARGEDDRPVRPDRERKSSGSETTFQDDLTDHATIEVAVLAQADEVWEWCQKANAYGRTVTVKIKYADFQIMTRSRSVTSVVASRAELHLLSLELMRSAYPLPKGVRLVGVSVSNFEAPMVESADQPAPSLLGMKCPNKNRVIRRPDYAS